MITGVLPPCPWTTLLPNLLPINPEVVSAFFLPTAICHILLFLVVGNVHIVQVEDHDGNVQKMDDGHLLSEEHGVSYEICLIVFCVTNKFEFCDTCQGM